ncbi:uncharacterized protein AKAW2_11671S [Aspergillus luchuensis]|uniref:Uncharacterized protein n=1 Tax=Aspergillus kawachii TaxID=1069201 RepID=A0A7R7WQX1_ASPKA|nr:uncharacterized protein AKAW2_11671S [Aspergillus luchuensis]BCR94625.1 hypothetical protein AKAW2_11671S [Aspergillus luchuensis]BCS07215.1 hypothetical protein ALUC_11596S [Aspergillus luchuensis]
MGFCRFLNHSDVLRIRSSELNRIGQALRRMSTINSGPTSRPACVNPPLDISRRQTEAATAAVRQQPTQSSAPMQSNPAVSDSRSASVAGWCICGYWAVRLALFYN